MLYFFSFFFFFQAEDGIRDLTVTGVQTCALPIYGPVKEVVLTGDAIDLLEFPVPKWHREDGGRYINTLQGTVTMDPDTGRLNVGVYRGMVGQKNTIPSLLWRAQNWGGDFAQWVGGGRAGAPVERGRCETVPLLVPASAEVVIEGYISNDPKTFEMEGPFGEYTGYFGGDQGPKHTHP